MNDIKKSNPRKSPLSLRVVLLLALTMIPFGLYWSMNRDSTLGMGICAAAYVLNMGVLVCLR